jgi:hypothetical protein
MSCLFSFLVGQASWPVFSRLRVLRAVRATGQEACPTL